MSFANAVAFVLARETGKLTENPNDPGGLTRWGIALARHPELTADQIRNMTQEGAAQIYAGPQYWDAIDGDRLPDYLHTPMLDSAVVQGPEVAIRSLQSALYVPVDGAIGDHTLAAAAAGVPKEVLARFTAARIHHFSLNSNWVANEDGWTTRAAWAALEAFQ